MAVAAGFGVDGPRGSPGLDVDVVAAGLAGVEEDATSRGAPSLRRAASSPSRRRLSFPPDLLRSLGERQEPVLLPQAQTHLDVPLAKRREPSPVLRALRPDQDANRPQLQLQLGHQRVRRRVFVFIRELARPEGAGGVGNVDVKPAVRPEFLSAHGLDLRIRRFNPSSRVVPQSLERGFNLAARRFRHIDGLVDGPVVHDVDAKDHPGFD